MQYSVVDITESHWVGKLNENNFTKIVSSILHELTERKDPLCYSLLEMRYPGYHISKLENYLKEYFVEFLSTLYNTLAPLSDKQWFYRHNEPYKKKVTRRSYIKWICKKIVELFETFEELLKLFGATDSVLEPSIDFDKGKGAIYYIDSFGLDFGAANNFMWSFYDEFSDSISDIIFKLSKISDQNIDIEQIYNLMRNLWFKLHISTFYMSYIKTNAFGKYKIHIPFVQQFYEHPPEGVLDAIKTMQLKFKNI